MSDKELGVGINTPNPTGDIRDKAIEVLKASHWGNPYVNERIVDALIASGVIRETDNTGDDEKARVRQQLLDTKRVVQQVLDDPMSKKFTTELQAAQISLALSAAALLGRSSGVADTVKEEDEPFVSRFRENPNAKDGFND